MKGTSQRIVYINTLDDTTRAPTLEGTVKQLRALGLSKNNKQWFNFTLEDETGTIRISCFNDAERFRKDLTEGCRIQISQFTVTQKTANDLKFDKSSSPYSIMMTKGTQIHILAAGDPNAPSYGGSSQAFTDANLSTISQAKDELARKAGEALDTASGNVSENVFVNVIVGIIGARYNHSISKASNKAYTKLTLTCVDRDGMSFDVAGFSSEDVIIDGYRSMVCDKTLENIPTTFLKNIERSLEVIEGARSQFNSGRNDAGPTPDQDRLNELLEPYSKEIRDTFIKECFQNRIVLISPIVVKNDDRYGFQYSLTRKSRVVYLPANPLSPKGKEALSAIFPSDQIPSKVTDFIRWYLSEDGKGKVKEYQNSHDSLNGSNNINGSLGGQDNAPGRCSFESLKSTPLATIHEFITDENITTCHLNGAILMPVQVVETSDCLYYGCSNCKRKIATEGDRCTNTKPGCETAPPTWFYMLRFLLSDYTDQINIRLFGDDAKAITQLSAEEAHEMIQSDPLKFMDRLGGARIINCLLLKKQGRDNTVNYSMSRFDFKNGMLEAVTETSQVLVQQYD